jgi:tetratricopeptide (TPR) repeat protein
MATIALCMIVRDEAAVIERCLASARPFLDGWVICDTGSTDGTPERIEAALSGIPGELHRHEWHDFGANRSELMECAFGKAEYLLLLDADMTLSVDAWPESLTEDAYLIRHAGSLDYAVPRLVRGDISWRYEGSTHEYLTADGDHSSEVLPGVVVEHHADGSARAHKLERDLALLERDLTENPRDARALFYLAQTYADLGEDERAIELYTRRVTLGDWDEEAFYAAYRAGALLASAGADKAVAQLLRAWELRPSRAEPLCELARFCRDRGWHRSAQLYARTGLGVPYPDDLLFVHRDVYEWGLLMELSIAAYWTGDIDEALEACDLLLERPGLPSDVRHQAIENRDACLEALGRSADPRSERGWRGIPRLATLAPSTQLAELTLDVAPRWAQFNPTIAADSDGFRAIVRTANYVLEDGSYRMLDGADAIVTINYLVRLDAGLSIIGVEPIEDATAGPPRHPSRVLGYEDMRLVCLGGRWLASATVRDRNPEQRCEIALLELDGARIESVALVPGPDPSRHEKNWMPFVRDAELLFVYTVDPTCVFRYDVARGVLALAGDLPGPGLDTDLRGGSQGVDVDGGTLFVVHEARDAGGRREYAHRLVLVDERLGVGGISSRFGFTGEEIEFCAGLAAAGDDLLLAFGVGDRRAGIARVSTREALGLLEPVG